MRQYSKVIYLLGAAPRSDLFPAFRIYMRAGPLALDDVARNNASKVEQKIQLAKELAATLRRNVVQAKKVETSSGEAAWSGCSSETL